ncbi:MAG: toll/interleukin-1 receptor domain-containing protein, partial [Sedimenticolaceae bacterium]
MSAIFLSYRRDDSSGYAGRLFDNLAESFGRERVFMDIETIEPGMDFVAGIDRAIESCGAVIAMIGPNWINAQDANGRRRLDNPRDFIRLEITSALTRGVRVIPVLVHNASMPPEQELPEPLRPLCRLQACEISDNRWEFDVRRLTDVIDPLIAEPEQSPTAAATAAKAAAEATSTTKAPGRKAGGGPTAWLVAVAALILAAVG